MLIGCPRQGSSCRGLIAERQNMNGKEVLFAHSSDEWSTPQAVFDKLDDEFHFTLDPCATEENAKCKNFYTMSDDGLLPSWGGQRVFCNPPYSNIQGWVQKAYYESQKDNTIVVMLIPARTDTRWFHDYIYHKAEVRFLKGRLKFGDAKYNAPFPSMIVVFGQQEQ